MVVLAEVVDAPAPRPARYGLFAAANGPLDLPLGLALGNGVQFRPVSCGSADLLPIDCEPVTSPPQTFADADPYIVAEPFLARATHKCKSVGSKPADLEAIVRQKLALGEQTVAEAGMALALSQSPVTVAADPDSIRSVVGALEQWLYGIDTASYGPRGVLHAPARAMAYAAAAGLLVKDGNVLTTPFGTVWSIGGGYPDGDIYISGTVGVWRAAEVTVPDPVQTFDRASNTYLLTADREYAVSYDCVAGVTSFIPDVPLS